MSRIWKQEFFLAASTLPLWQEGVPPFVQRWYPMASEVPPHGVWRGREYTPGRGTSSFCESIDL